ncbi:MULTISPECIES: holo-ACP synthase [Halanaerobium]|jgi:holo-[acyl-carrier protein] synthase|uniref:Holo-[acyl-carrier-protein] synthase n=1 Tax=Halanaerobium kushneri TaxID=56779 RepID=A0A1N6W3Y3_9FIRM|nr:MULTISPECIES: holo-ACP synthase [Halanaerobium]RCW53982.1 holo-[acyl-carrier-protein] synthase [Halanaerobium sp. ST460_2HS_T2]SIQ84758.1 holo-[acyl-carrier-protein] synthase [Halanaerobium kushneri]
MILGTGIDIVKNKRIKSLIEKYEDRFLKKIYTEAEIEYCQQKINSAASFAARFAAKEAVLKALGTGMRKNSWQDIEVLNDELGKPEVKLSGSTKFRAKELNVSSIFISISHEKDFSVAQVIMEGAD